MPNPVSAPSFTAQWPKGMEPTMGGTILNRVWDVVSIVIFPIGLARLGYWGLQDLAGRIIHPATVWNTADLAVHRQFLIQAGGKEVSIGTPDGETVNAMLFRGTGRNGGAIVKSFGNNTYYEQSGGDFVDFVRANVGSDVDILLVNTRGCAKSTGKTSPQGMALDTFSAGQYMVKQEGTDPNCVLFYGHSLGGYSAVAGAGLFQKMYPKAAVSAVNDRSFKSLIDAARVIYNTAASWLVWFLDWELNAQKAWEELKGQKIVVYSKRDNIPYPCSFHHYVNHSRRTSATEVELSDAYDDIHNRGFDASEGAKIGRHIRAAIDKTLPSNEMAG